MHMYTHTRTYIYIYTHNKNNNNYYYIYIERERDRGIHCRTTHYTHANHLFTKSLTPHVSLRIPSCTSISLRDPSCPICEALTVFITVIMN